MKKLLKRIYQNKLQIIIFFIFFWQWSCPGAAIASPLESKESIDIIVKDTSQFLAEIKVAVEPEIKVVSTRLVTLTAYSSTVDQCDDTPCITANGYNLCENNQENVVAANFLPFNTKIRIPEYFGDRVFTVQDRMNKRFSNRVDVWMKTRGDALKFGIRRLTIEVIE